MFQLSNNFLQPYRDKEPPFGPLGKFTFYRTYSREGETWTDTVARVVQGCYSWQRLHCIAEKRPWSDEQAVRSMETMFDLMWNMKFLPPGRGLRNMGTEVLYKSGAAANNCGFVSTAGTLSDAAAWAMDMLMMGVGVGFDTKGAGMVIEQPADYGNAINSTHVISDSREGWVEAVRLLIESYEQSDMSSISFDYSQIRPAGSPIKGFGGVASGPQPLIECIESIRALLDRRIRESYEEWPDCGELTAADINDVMALIGRCVVSGGVRRSAEISFIEEGDYAAYDLKDRSKYVEENRDYRWASNHSITCSPGADYSDIVARTAGVDELGIFWLENAQTYSRMGRRPDNADSKALGCNPCAEQTLEHKELCCLVEVFPSRIESLYEFQKVLKYAYLYAKSVTTIPVHDKETQSIVERNRRIGCSLTGIQESIANLGHSEFYSWCDKGYKYLKQLDERYSEWLGINRSVKITSVKPSGTVSKLPGVSSGIHFPISKSYFQVIRVASNSPYVELHKKAGYKVVDLAPGEPNTTAIYFGVLDSSSVRTESEVSLWEQAEHAAKMQHYWADNQVSITVKYKPEEREQIPALLSMYEDRLKAISFFPFSDAHDFEHAPWQPADASDVQKYLDSLTPVEYNTTNETHETDDVFCSGESCELPANYFDGATD